MLLIFLTQQKDIAIQCYLNIVRVFFFSFEISNANNAEKSIASKPHMRFNMPATHANNDHVNGKTVIWNVVYSAMALIGLQKHSVHLTQNVAICISRKMPILNHVMSHSPQSIKCCERKKSVSLTPSFSSCK